MNAYEVIARENKADRLFAALRKAGATLEAVLAMDEDAWRLAADAAGVRQPSQRTKDRVIRIFRVLQDDGEDPFPKED